MPVKASIKKKGKKRLGKAKKKLNLSILIPAATQAPLASARTWCQVSLFDELDTISTELLSGKKNKKRQPGSHSESTEACVYKASGSDSEDCGKPEYSTNSPGPCLQENPLYQQLHSDCKTFWSSFTNRKAVDILKEQKHFEVTSFFIDLRRHLHELTAPTSRDIQMKHLLDVYQWWKDRHPHTSQDGVCKQKANQDEKLTEFSGRAEGAPEGYTLPYTEKDGNGGKRTHTHSKLISALASSKCTGVCPASAFWTGWCEAKGSVNDTSPYGRNDCQSFIPSQRAGSHFTDFQSIRSFSCSSSSSSSATCLNSETVADRSWTISQIQNVTNTQQKTQFLMHVEAHMPFCSAEEELKEYEFRNMVPSPRSKRTGRPCFDHRSLRISRSRISDKYGLNQNTTGTQTSRTESAYPEIFTKENGEKLEQDEENREQSTSDIYRLHRWHEPWGAVLRDSTGLQGLHEVQDSAVGHPPQYMFQGTVASENMEARIGQRINEFWERRATDEAVGKWKNSILNSLSTRRMWAQQNFERNIESFKHYYKFLAFERVVFTSNCRGLNSSSKSVRCKNYEACVSSKISGVLSNHQSTNHPLEKSASDYPPSDVFGDMRYGDSSIDGVPEEWSNNKKEDYLHNSASESEIHSNEEGTVESDEDWDQEQECNLFNLQRGRNIKKPLRATVEDTSEPNRGDEKCDNFLIHDKKSQNTDRVSVATSRSYAAEAATTGPDLIDDPRTSHISPFHPLECFKLASTSRLEAVKKRMETNENSQRWIDKIASALKTSEENLKQADAKQKGAAAKQIPSTKSDNNPKKQASEKKVEMKPAPVIPCPVVYTSLLKDPVKRPTGKFKKKNANERPNHMN